MSRSVVIFDCHGVLFTGRNLERNTDLFEFAKSLKSQGLRLAILSNISQSDIDSLLSESDKMLFDEIAASGAIGAAKPHPEAYEFVLERLLAHPSEAIFIDDNKDNVLGAQHLGICGILYNENAACIKSVEEAINA